MRFAVVLVTTLVGCKSLLGIDPGVVGDGGASGDSEIEDAIDDAVVDADCYGQDPFRVCPGAVTPTSPLPTVIDSIVDCDFVDTTNGRNWCVLVRASVSISSGVRATGNRPLVILSRTNLTIGLGGIVDASSQADQLASGPGAGFTDCMLGNGLPGGGMGQGSGGAGGSFGSVGGKGGAGHGTDTPGALSQPVMTATTLRGGCQGGLGGGTTVKAGGKGGGAIYLVAGTTLTIEGLVNASGAGGGFGVMPGSGGSGGGSGGMIVLSAPVVSVTSNAQVFANGGGGGSGGGNSLNGSFGTDPSSPSDGGRGGDAGTGGFGGDGASGITAADPGADDAAGGGGGGGGVGIVRVLAPSQQLSPGVISPPPS